MGFARKTDVCLVLGRFSVKGDKDKAAAIYHMRGGPLLSKNALHIFVGRPLIPIEQNARVLLLPACLRGCFPVPAYPLGAY
jgi:hypothetical protein